MAHGLILGLNQYTHSAAACILSPQGEVLFAGEKERLTRKKHDGGDVAVLVEHALESIGADCGDLALVVANNHLFRIDRFHRTVAWDTALYSYPESYASTWNLLPDVPRLELSHHLAHAWSVLPLAPFEDGLIAVMDGMGSTLHEMRMPGEEYRSELELPSAEGFLVSPEGVEQGKAKPAFGWREGESLFRFHGLKLERLFKRWIEEKTPPLLHNYGFQDMESLGAVYSRVASHVFGDWNSCGKVMGLAPWAPRWAKDMDYRPVMQGPLESLQVDVDRLRRQAGPNSWREESTRPGLARFAADMQRDLEEITLEFLQRQQAQTGARNLALCGGVALNSTLNGRICREAGFEQVFIPPYPGDQGIAVGCAFFGLHHLARQAGGEMPVSRRPLPPYLGRDWPKEECERAITPFEPWLEEADLDGEDLIEVIAAALADDQVVALCEGPAEFGPRALGNRSILADPRKAHNIDRINSAIKKREAFRPFAPTVLEESLADWFEDSTPSPYMSITAMAKEECRARIPAVVHVDGSARYQSLSATAHPRFHALIRAFESRTGIPMVLNTSFNIRGEPMVESPHDAIWSFLRSDIDLLVLEGRLFRRRTFPDPITGDRIPVAVDGWSAEVLSDAAGEALSVRLMARGETYELDQLSLGLLEAVDGATPLGTLVEYFQESWEVESSQTLEAFENLFEKRLLGLIPSDQS